MQHSQLKLTQLSPSSHCAGDCKNLAQATKACCLQPLCFFISWQGVLTLVYSGFPSALVELKGRLAAEWPQLQKENPGSLWPKTTLAPLKDGKRLTPEQFGGLNSLCKKYTRVLGASPAPLQIREVALAVYGCRSLERTLSMQVFPLAKAGENFSSEIADSELARVAAVVSEADGVDYWFAVSKDGSRESHYRGPAFGCTLMVPLGGRAQAFPDALARIVFGFLNDVDALLPGYYCRLDPTSYHVTLRGVIG